MTIADKIKAAQAAAERRWNRQRATDQKILAAGEPTLRGRFLTLANFNKRHTRWVLARYRETSREVMLMRPKAPYIVEATQ